MQDREAILARKIAIRKAREEKKREEAIRKEIKQKQLDLANGYVTSVARERRSSAETMLSARHVEQTPTQSTMDVLDDDESGVVLSALPMDGWELANHTVAVAFESGGLSGYGVRLASQPLGTVTVAVRENRTVPEGSAGQSVAGGLDCVAGDAASSTSVGSSAGAGAEAVSLTHSTASVAGSQM